MAERPLSAGNSIDLQDYEPQPSLWNYIKMCASKHELPEVKLLLGQSLVEQSLELHQEVELLVEIWRDFRQETLKRRPKPSLPEPPAQRELLKAEIKFFIDNIHEKAQACGRNPDLILSRHNSQIMDYVLDDKGRSSCSSRSSTDSPLSRIDRETSLSRASSRLSGGRRESVISVEGVQAAFNGRTVFQLDDVIQHLRDFLQREVNDLTEDVDYIQRCLEEEADSMSQSHLEKEPTLSELREERTSLEKELLSADFNDVTRATLNKATSRDVPASHLGDHRLSSAPVRQGKDEEKSPIGSRTAWQKADSPVRNTPVEVHAFDKTLSSSLRRVKLSPTSQRRLESAPNIASRVLKSSAPSHVTVRTGTNKTCQAVETGLQVVHLGSLPVDSVFPCSPAPPSAPRSVLRPSSAAQRFRNMVLECRDGK